MKLEYENEIFEKISSRASFAYGRYWLHKYQAVIEFDRVQQCLHEKSLYGEWLKEPDITQEDAIRLWFHFGIIINEKLLAEVHLYFISLDNIKDMINVITSEKNLIFIKKDIGDINKILEHYSKGRNTFEHFDDRIPGGKRHKDAKDVVDIESGNTRKILGGLKGDIYKFEDQEWSLSASNFQEIINGLNKFETILHDYLSKLKL